MEREKKTKASEQQENTVSVDMAKLTEGISLVFSGAVKMFEAVGSVEVGLVMNTAKAPIVVDTGEELTIEEDVPDEPQKKPEEKSQEEKPQKPGKPARPITTDDITRIIVRKIKQKKSNNEKIGQILKSYGVGKVSDLSPEKYEAFVTDLAAL